MENKYIIPEVVLVKIEIENEIATSIIVPVTDNDAPEGAVADGKEYGWGELDFCLWEE
uniref:Uncharacterized protein n=2 Tax=unclassified Prevotella TaxID=2638335 RepID=A0AB33J2K4_9BACT